MWLHLSATRLAMLTLMLACSACSAGPTRDVRDHQPPPRPTVPCGELTCGARERCVVKCECCGIPVPREKLRASYRCEPMPDACFESAPIDPSLDCRRVVERPCA